MGRLGRLLLAAVQYQHQGGAGVGGDLRVQRQLGGTGRGGAVGAVQDQDVGVLMIWKEGTMVWAVVWAAPETMPSASPMCTIMVPK